MSTTRASVSPLVVTCAVVFGFAAAACNSSGEATNSESLQPLALDAQEDSDSLPGEDGVGSECEVLGECSAEVLDAAGEPTSTGLVLTVSHEETTSSQFTVTVKLFSTKPASADQSVDVIESRTRGGAYPFFPARFQFDLEPGEYWASLVLRNAVDESMVAELVYPEALLVSPQGYTQISAIDL